MEIGPAFNKPNLKVTNHGSNIIILLMQYFSQSSTASLRQKVYPELRNN